MRRWIKRITITVLVVGLLAAALVQVLLWTDVPRRYVVHQLEQVTGLNVGLGELQTGWAGRTHIANLTLTIPGEDQALLAIDRADLQHTALVSLIAGRGLAIRSIEGDKLKLRLVQAPTGRWNIERAASLLQTGEGEGEGDDPLGSFKHMRLGELAVTVKDAEDRQTALVLQVEADAIGPGAIAFRIDAGEVAQATGRFNTRGRQAHQLHIAVADAHALAGDWMTAVPRPANGQLKWTGALPGGLPVGRLDVESLRIGQQAADGALAIRINDQQLRLSPQKLLLSRTNHRVTLDGGTIALQTASPQIRFEHLKLCTDALLATLSGLYDTQTGAGEMVGRWTHADDEASNSYEGTLDARVKPLREGLDLQLDWATNGNVDRWQWAGQGALTGRGADWTSLDWQLAVNEGQWAWAVDGERRIWPLSGLSARGKMVWPVITLAALDHKIGGPIHATAKLDAKRWHWNATLTGRGLALAQSPLDAFDVTLAIHGDDQALQIDTATLTGEPWTLDIASAQYRWARDAKPPLTATFKVGWHHTDEQEGHGVRLAFTGRLSGQTQSMDLSIDGKLTADQLQFANQPIQQIITPLNGRIGTDSMAARTGTFSTLGGRANLNARHRFTDAATTFDVNATQLSLSSIAKLFQIDPAPVGRLDTTLSIELPTTKPADFRIDGHVTVDAMRYQGVAIDRLKARIAQSQPGVIGMTSIRAEYDQGVAEARATFDLNQNNGSIDVALEQWPLSLTDQAITGKVDGTATVELVSLRGLTLGRTTFQLTGQTEFEGHPIGVLDLAGTWHEKQLIVTLAESKALGGTIHGQATLRPDNWLTTDAKLVWTGLDLDVLEPWFAWTAPLDGQADGTLILTPTDDPHAPEPLRAQLHLKPAGQWYWRKVRLGVLEAEAYLGKDRIVVHESQFDLADGRISAWASFRPRQDHWRGHMRAKLNNLDINQLRMLLPAQDDQPVPGRLTGTLNSYGPLHSWTAQTAEADLRLTQSDLIHTDIIGGLLRRVGLKTTNPDGTGQATLRMADRQLTVKRLVYQNGAGRLLMHGSIRDVLLGMDSPIEATAVGMLGKTGLTPGEFERLVDSLQTKVTTFKINGFLKDYRVTPGSIDNWKQWIRHRFAN